MIKSRFLLATFVGIFVYTLVSFIAGRNGVICYAQLNEQKKEISLQVANIQNINNELKLEFSALEKDRDVIAAYARKLNYVSNDEKIVKINGLKPYQSAIYDFGTVLKRKPINFLSESYCKIFGLIFFSLTLLILLLVDIKNGTITFKKEKSVIQGIPVYDMPQI